MARTYRLIVLASWAIGTIAQNIPSGASPSYVVSSAFTSAFSSYWTRPNPTAEPEPVVVDPILNITFPRNLTDPFTIPENVTSDPLYYPSAIANLTRAGQQAVISSAVSQIEAIIVSSQFPTNCSRCIAGLGIAKQAALLAPEMVPEVMITLCQQYKLHSNATCEEEFNANAFGAIWTQVLGLADVSGLDGQYICSTFGGSTFCPAPLTSPLNTTDLFPKPKPDHAKQWTANGNRTRVLHSSDIHLDPCYGAGSEANCTSSLCCRWNNPNTDISSGQISLASPLYGTWKCDSPYDLVLGSLQSIAPMTGTSENDLLGFALYTGDLVSHEGQDELSRAYVEYAETSLYGLLKRYLHNVPVFPALGNHDTNPEAIDAPHSLPGNLSQQMSWNFDHVASLWQHEGWLNATAASYARTHYGEYSVKTSAGLRIIAFNTGFWYKSNFLNFIDTTKLDKSGQF
ncbi:hypothetical protein AAFC00_005115 [Neodothiora populina]|uniref:Calcineurin-like phosphoesterase domain-containing protein n=1 Tax=Neodothiora populina TaxID=2781224 RepID=A0ABR3PK84_9PEZI